MGTCRGLTRSKDTRESALRSTTGDAVESALQAVSWKFSPSRDESVSFLQDERRSSGASQRTKSASAVAHTTLRPLARHERFIDRTDT
jgi:hypothetical protein